MPYNILSDFYVEVKPYCDHLNLSYQAFPALFSTISGKIKRCGGIAQSFDPSHLQTALNLYLLCSGGQKSVFITDVADGLVPRLSRASFVICFANSL